VIFSVGQAINGPFRILRADLGVSGTPENVTAAIKSSPAGSNTLTIGTDNQIAHLPNSDMLLARNAGTTFDILPKGSNAEINSRAWWNIASLPVPGYRVGLTFYRPGNGGKT
jgi:hypothetical protein